MDYSLGLAAGQDDKDSLPAPRPTAEPLTGAAAPQSPGQMLCSTECSRLEKRPPTYIGSAL